MNRRLFFRAPELARTASHVLPPFAEPVIDETDATFALVRVSRRAMATRFEIAIPYGHPHAVPAAQDALDLIDELEDQLTVFRDHSEVSRLNAGAAEGSVPVSEELFELLRDCAGLTRETEGAFDIATGSLTRAWGFYHREGKLPSPRERSLAMAATGMKHVVLDEANRSIRFRVKGLEFNLGAIGKGYALDRAADLLRTKWGITTALLQGGGSSILGLGTPPDDRRGWSIRLRHPADDGRSLGTVHLADSALGVSAATFQHFTCNNRSLGHLLDPRLGWPAEGTASAAVIAPTAAEADAISTAVYVLGEPGADRLTRLRPYLGALVLRAGQVEPSLYNLDTLYHSPTGLNEPSLAPAHAD